VSPGVLADVAEHRAGERKEVLGAKVGADLGQGFEGRTASPRRPLPGFERPADLAPESHRSTHGGASHRPEPRPPRLHRWGRAGAGV